jgi:gamma-glutamyltranspeptidase/glutathione hydrolase
MSIRSLVITFVVICLAVTTGWAQDDSDLPTAVITEREMVVTANPLATEAGEKILKIGGTATDAMIAVQTVLGLVEPQSSGLGGGSFVVYYDAKTGKTTTIDAREKAPSAAEGDRFSGLSWTEAWQTGLSVGVPGTPRMLEYMHDRYGKLPWPRLFVPAKTLAQKGFELTERTSSQVAGMLADNSSCKDGERFFFRDPTAFEYFVDTDECTAKPAGTLMKNKAYADTLKALAQKGADAFYDGPIAKDIADAVQGDLSIPGDMTVDDLANYEVVERKPVCVEYLGYNVCGMGPPSSGGLAVGQILGIMKYRPDLMGSSPLDVKTVHLFTQAGRLAFADRNKYVADTDFITVPVEGMLDEGYLASRAELISDWDMGPAEAGVPPDKFDPYAPDFSSKLSGTSHVSIIDRYGNALSMTSSVESSFGNGVMVRGFMLNNELTDFSFQSENGEGVPIANRVQPNKRPRSSMSPTIVLDGDGDVALLTGSPGGSRIIMYTAQSIMNVLNFELDPQEAINMPHYMNRNLYTELETPTPGIILDYDAGALAEQLQYDYGHSDVRIGAKTSGLSIIQVVESDLEKPGKGHGKGPKQNETMLVGGADQRRDGAVGGQ